MVHAGTAARSELQDHKGLDQNLTHILGLKQTYPPDVVGNESAGVCQGQHRVLKSESESKHPRDRHRSEYPRERDESESQQRQDGDGPSHNTLKSTSLIWLLFIV